MHHDLLAASLHMSRCGNFTFGVVFSDLRISLANRSLCLLFSLGKCGYSFQDRVLDDIIKPIQVFFEVSECHILHEALWILPPLLILDVVVLSLDIIEHISQVEGSSVIFKRPLAEGQEHFFVELHLIAELSKHLIIFLLTSAPSTLAGSSPCRHDYS